MKVKSATESVGLFKPVGEKRDADGFEDRLKRENERQNSGDRGDEREQIEVSDEKVGSAIEGFGRDEQALANGLTAAAVGMGPGLRVVLKDAKGGIVRQMSGEEFLRLRETVDKDRRARGKILDQKL